MTDKIEQMVSFSGLRTIAIVGIVFAVIVVLILAALGLYYFCGNARKELNKHEHTRPELPDMRNQYEYDDEERGFSDDSAQGEASDEVGIYNNSSSGTWRNENIMNEIKERGKTILDCRDAEGHVYMNGSVGGKLGPVRFEKLSTNESVSSTETLTTPLSADISRDMADDMFNASKLSTARSRTVSGGSGLNPVPEELIAPSESLNKRDHQPADGNGGKMLPLEGIGRQDSTGSSPYHDQSSYNSSDNSSIGSYNKVGFEHDVHLNDSYNSSDNSSPMPGLLTSVQGTNYHTLSSPESSPERTIPPESKDHKPKHGDMANTGARSKVPLHNTQMARPPPPSDTDGSEHYDVPSVISPYSKVDHVDLPTSPEYDSSAGSFASTDTVIDAFKDKGKTSQQHNPIDNYVSESFMQNMAPASSTHSISEAEQSDSDLSDIGPYCIVGETGASQVPGHGGADSKNQSYHSQSDHDDGSDESQPFLHDDRSTGQMDQSVNLSDRGYVMAPPVTGMVAPSQTPANATAGPCINNSRLLPSTTFQDPGYVQSVDIPTNDSPYVVVENTNKQLSAMPSMPDYVENNSYLPHAALNGVNPGISNAGCGSSPKVSVEAVSSNGGSSNLACPSTGFNSPAGPINSKQPVLHSQNRETQPPELNYISHDSVQNHISVPSINATSCVDPEKQNNHKTVQPQRNDNYVTLDTLPNGIHANKLPNGITGNTLTNGCSIDTDSNATESDEHEDYNDRGSSADNTPSLIHNNNGYVAHVTC